MSRRLRSRLVSAKMVRFQGLVSGLIDFQVYSEIKTEGRRSMRILFKFSKFDNSLADNF